MNFCQLEKRNDYSTIQIQYRTCNNVLYIDEWDHMNNKKDCFDNFYLKLWSVCKLFITIAFKPTIFKIHVHGNQYKRFLFNKLSTKIHWIFVHDVEVSQPGTVL